MAHLVCSRLDSKVENTVMVKRICRTKEGAEADIATRNEHLYFRILRQGRDPGRTTPPYVYVDQRGVLGCHVTIGAPFGPDDDG